MPTYVYECKTCNEVYEVEQRITDDPLTDCRCGAIGSLKRLIQPVGIAFKGSGFYVNDSSVATPKAECTGEPTTCACSSPTE
jgi:putative FmdB family regulatory protein